MLAKKINIPSLEVELQELSIAFFSFNVSLMRQNSSFAQTLSDKNKVRRSPLVLSNQAWQSREKLRCLVAFVEGPHYLWSTLFVFLWNKTKPLANYLKTRIF